MLLQYVEASVLEEGLAESITACVGVPIERDGSYTEEPIDQWGTFKSGGERADGLFVPYIVSK